LNNDRTLVPVHREPVADEQAIAAGGQERVRWELAAMAGRLRTLDRELADSQAENLRLTRDLARERKRSQTLRESETYRLGQAAVALVRNPARTVPRLARAALRRLKQGHRRPRPAGTGTATAEPAVKRRRPVHLYVAIGLDVDALRTFVQTLNQRLLVNADHSPVVVTDCAEFALLRNLGVILEYLPDRYTWLQHRPDLPWDDVLSERMSRLYHDHTAVRTVIVDRLRPPTLAELLR
jgi:hypothetical protein